MAEQAAVTHKNAYTPGMESRSKRRALVNMIMAQLQSIQYNEEICMANIPESLWESAAFENAEQSAASLRDAIESLEYAY